MNLNSDAAVGDVFTSSITTYDSLGSEAVLDVDFTRTATGWDWAVAVSHDNPWLHLHPPGLWYLTDR
jgi:hypothetical protein